MQTHVLTEHADNEQIREEAIQPATGKRDPGLNFEPKPTRPGWGGALVILALLLSPFLASNIPNAVDKIF